MQKKTAINVVRRYIFCGAVCLYSSKSISQNLSIARGLPGIMPCGARTFLQTNKNAESIFISQAADPVHRYKLIVCFRVDIDYLLFFIIVIIIFVFNIVKIGKSACVFGVKVIFLAFGRFFVKEDS